MKSLVAIVGRPNVGKSTLFNRLIQKRLAIVQNIPGITRDRLYAEAEWQGRGFRLVDTGGMNPEASGGIEGQVRWQAEVAVAEADLILFVVDVREGLTHTDEEAARFLRKAGKPVILVANKVDHPSVHPRAYEFYALGFGEPVPVSAEHGMNTGDLLDLVVSQLPPEAAETTSPDALPVAVVGRPNVGKSSLVNRLLGEERMIVSETPGTTRDAVDIMVNTDWGPMTFIDTAGMRRRARIEAAVEHYSVLRALRAVDRAEVVLLILDATQPVAEQDQRVAGYVRDSGKAAIILANKWDLMTGEEGVAEEYLAGVRERLYFLHYAPIQLVSALTGRRLSQIAETIQHVAARHASEVPTPALNRLVRDAQEIHPPPTRKGKQFKIYYATQVRKRPPSFVFFVNNPNLLHYSYERFLENTLRERYDFTGTPLRLFFREG